MSRNGQQNMTLIGKELEKVLLPSNQEKIVKVSDGGTPSDGGTLTLQKKYCFSTVIPNFVGTKIM